MNRFGLLVVVLGLVASSSSGQSPEYDTNGDGATTFSEYYFSQSSTPGFREALFGDLDQNRDGELSSREIRLTPADWAEADKDGSGTLGFKELIHALEEKRLAGLLNSKMAAEDTDRAFFVIGSVGKALIRKPADADYLALGEIRAEVPNHSCVKAGGDGPAFILLKDGAVLTLFPGAEVQVNEYQKGTTVRQPAGHVGYKINAPARGGRYFYTQTRWGKLEPKGTLYFVEILGNPIVVDTSQGMVSVVITHERYGADGTPLARPLDHPLRVNIYPDGRWAFGTFEYDPTPGAANTYHYDGTPLTQAERDARFPPPRDVRPGERGTIEPDADGKGPGDTRVGLQDADPFRQQLREIGTRYGDEQDRIERERLRGNISSEEAYRRSQLVHAQCLAEYARLAAKFGRGIGQAVPAPRSVDDMDCDYIRNFALPHAKPAIAKLRSNPQQKEVADQVLDFVGGLDGYENWLDHLCDDDVIDAEERKQLRILSEHYGFGAAEKP